MPAPYEAAMPPELDLGDGYTLRLTALDPTDGSQVAGVTVANLAMEVVNVGDGGDGGLAFGDFQLVPGPDA